MTSSSAPLGWLGIVRLGLVQTALGSIVVLTTTTMNRVMVVELALPAVLPGALVAFHYVLQFLRPRWGHGSDIGQRRTPWILGGMVTLAAGGTGAALATALMAQNFFAGLALAILSFALIGAGVGAAGTTLLTFLAMRVAPERRGAAATIVWMMMIFGFAVTTVTAGHFLDPYSGQRLVAITATVAALAVLLTVLAIWHMEERTAPGAASTAAVRKQTNFKASLSEVWHEPQTRRFTIFVFVSMIAYSMQELIIEPFSALLFDLTPGQTTKLGGLQHSGVFLGMALVAVSGSVLRLPVTLRTWTAGGCLASGLALAALVVSGNLADERLMRAAIFALGFANGAFAVAAIGSMMQLASQGAKDREGVRMGLWGAAQAIAFGSGGFTGTVLADLLRKSLGEPVAAYAIVFTLEALLFAVSAVLAWRAIERSGQGQARSNRSLRPVVFETGSGVAS